MIDVGKNTREELDKVFRSDVRQEAILYSNYTKADEPLWDEQVAKSSLDVDVSRTGSGEYIDFCTFEPNTYDVDNPKRLFYQTGDPATEPNGGIVAKKFYTTSTTFENPYFFYYTYAMDEGTYCSGITLRFGTDETIYPTKFVIEFIDRFAESDTPLDKIEVNGNSSLFYSAYTSQANVSGVKVSVLEMNRPGVRLRISYIRMGYEMILSDEIVSCSTKRSAHPISTEAPSNEFSIEIWDENNIFDPQNQNGVYNNLRGDEYIENYLVFGNERSLLGSYRLSGKPKVSNHTVTFSCASDFWSNVSNSAIKVTGVAGESAATDPEGSGGERPVEFANRCVAYTTGAHDYFSTSVRGNIISRFNYSNITDTPINIVTLFANLSFYQLQEKPDGTVNTVLLLDGADETASGNSKEYALDKYGDKLITLSDEHICGDIELDTSVINAQTYKVSYYPSGGDTKKWLYYDVADGQSREGSDTDNTDVTLDNRLSCFSNAISPTGNANYYAKLFAIPRLDWWVAHASKYTIPYLADPTIEIGDFVKFKNKYGKDIYGFVTEVNYSYPMNVGSDSIVVYTVPENRLSKPEE